MSTASSDTSRRFRATSDADTPLVSMPEIASMAHVKRPVVSTWRRRYPDFPIPVAETSGRPLFDGEQIAQWLLTTGLGNTSPGQLRAEIALYGIAARADRSDPLRTIELLGALLSLRHLDEKPLTAGPGEESTTPSSHWAALQQRAARMDPDDEFVLREILVADADEAAPLARLAEQMLEAAYHEHGAYEWLLAARSRLGATALSADAPSHEVQRLMLELTDAQNRLELGGSITVADPYVRAGDHLASLIHASEDPGRVTVLAADPDERLTRILRRRLLLAGIDELALDVQTGAELEERLANPDLIITQLPYRPGEDRSRLTALEDIERIADLLGSGCTAVVLGPADALADGLTDAEEAALRSSLLRRNIVETVIALPGGSLPFRPGYRPALWVLTRGPVKAAEGNVLLLDVSAEPLTDRVCDRLAEDVLLWRAEGFRALGGHDPRYGRAVRVADLDRAFGGPLTPPAPPAHQLLAHTALERPALIADAETRLERATAQARAYDDAHGPYRGRLVRRTGPRPQRTTLGTLIKDGRVSRHKGHRIDRRHITSSGHHTILGPEEILGHAPVGTRCMDRLALAKHYEHVALTEPGDLVYTLAPEVGLHLDHDGFNVVAFPARILRVHPGVKRPITARVLAAMLAAARGTGRSPSAVRPARRIEDYQLPDLDPDDVARIDALLAEAEYRAQMLRAQADALAEAHRMTAAGLADGTLTVDSP